ncbi:hypothetical protein pEaSNUABM8_00118 [Erwinia phage pEa_SNUABM_8]|nr:hypothetical protein pEaSNUABM8_00118 [Erwinia phage pEa_SNUABM_8]QVW54870.1 hypothetical protein pEaSNUABM4_00117 [Erwinia phage pEa_SNUABM_4]
MDIHLYSSISSFFRNHQDTDKYQDCLSEWDYVTQDANFWAKYMAITEGEEVIAACHVILGDDSERTVTTILVTYEGNLDDFKEHVIAYLDELYHPTLIEFEAADECL